MAEAFPGQSGAADQDVRRPRQRRQARRLALVLAIVALAVYIGFILYSVLTAHH